MIKHPIYEKELIDYCNKFKSLLALFNGKKVLITGASGLIGSYVADLLLQSNKLLGIDAKVYLVDRDQETLLQRFKEYNNLYAQDILEGTVRYPAEIDYIIHCASNTSPLDYANKPIDTIRTNVEGTRILLDYAVESHAKKFIFCSSVEVYGKNNGDTEDFLESYSGYVDSNALRADYPSAKRCAEALLNAYFKEYNQGFVIGRIGRIYGPTILKNDQKAPTQFIRDGVNNRDIILKSEGLQEYSWGYVGDCATALLLLAINGVSGEAYNIADPKSKSKLIEFASICAKNCNRNVSICKLNKEEQKAYSTITKATMNTDKIISLGWKPQIHLEDGISRTIKILKEIQNT